MTIDAVIMLLGTFVALLPFLGFPVRWDSVLLVIVGVLVIVAGIIVRRRSTNESSAQHAFVESAPHLETEHAES